MSDTTGYLPQVSPFRVDILDASDNVLGDGPLYTVVKLDTVSRLDAIGGCSFEIPAADPRSQYITSGRKFDIWESPANDRTTGYLGRYLYKSKRLTDVQGVATLVVNCYDALRELSMYTVNFRRDYAAVAVETVIDDLISTVSGWQAESDSGIGTTSVTYEGESPLAAVDVLRDRWGKHYRLQSVDPALRVLEFGAFGDDSGVRLLHLDGQVQDRFELRPEVAIVNRITLVEEADEIFNSVIALGAGQGVSQLTMEQATAGSYDLDEGTNEDGSSFWYIQDDTSVANYGERWKILVLPNVRPISNSETGIADAADALKLMAEAYIARHLVPRVTYDVDVVALRKDVRPGDTVHLQYKGVVEGYSYINVDDDFYVMDVSIKRTASGERSARLTIASLAERRTTDMDIIVDIVRDVKAIKVHVPLTLAYAPIGPYVKRMDSSKDAEFTVRIKDEVTYCNRALLRFTTAPLRSSLASSTTSSSGSHRHLMFIYFSTGPSGQPPDDYFELYKCYRDPDGINELALLLGTNYPVDEDLYTYEEAEGHTHTLSYGLYEDTQYPASVSVAINGLDRTEELGGPWDTGGTGADVEVDITDYLVNAVGGLRQNHSIVFSCDSGQGEIESEIDLLVSIQAIAVS